MTDQTASPPTRGASGPQVAAIVGGSVAGILALLALVAGGLLLWGDSHKDRDGYLSTGSDPYSTRTYAIATDTLDVDGDIPGAVQDLAGKIRVRVAPHGADKPMFVGIAPTSEVSRYLRDSAHATVTDVNYDPFEATYRTKGGERRPAPPAAQRFWAASAQGTGTQSLTWDVKDGSWSIVVMNADGSAGVNAGVSAGVRLGWLQRAGPASLGTGALLAALAGGLLFVGPRPGRRAARPRGGPRVGGPAPPAAAAGRRSAPPGRRGDHRLLDALLAHAGLAVAG